MAEISVLIPVYNTDKFLSQAIQSVVDQTHQDWELVVLDDASTDKSFEIAKAFETKDPRIKALRNSTNLGMVANWNKGIGLCHSPYFIKLDADDAWKPGMLTKSLEIMKREPEVALIFTRYVNIDDSGTVVPGSETTIPDFARNKSFSCVPLVKLGVSQMLQYPILRQGLSLFRRKVFDAIGGYRLLASPQTQASSDTEFYFRVGCNHKIYCIDEVYYMYRIHSNSLSYVDRDMGLAELKMYELKMAIINYYLEQGKIQKSVWRKNKWETAFRFVLFQCSQGRSKGRYGEALSSLIILLLRYPIRTFRHILSKVNL